MKIFGFGDITGVYNFLKSKIYTKKKEEEEEVLFFEEEIEAAPAKKPAIAAFKPAPTEEAEQEQVIYVKWPLRAEMFVEVKAGSDVELKDGGLWTPDEKATRTPVDEMDVLHIPDVVNVPVLSPVLQGEKMMNVDILTSRGIFIGLSPIDTEWLFNSAPAEFLEMPSEEPSKEVKTQQEQPVIETPQEMQEIHEEPGSELHEMDVEERPAANSIFAFEQESDFGDGHFADPENTGLASDPELNIGTVKPESEVETEEITKKGGYFDILKKSTKSGRKKK